MYVHCSAHALRERCSDFAIIAFAQMVPVVTTENSLKLAALKLILAVFDNR